MHVRRYGWGLLWASLCWASPAPGAECGRQGRPWVSVAFDTPSFGSAHEARVLEDFRAGLSDRDIDVCPASSGPGHPAVAAVHVTETTATSVGVSVEVRDAVTQKRVARDVDLSAVPKDGRAFAVALAADELLRASWVELAIERARRPVRPPPPEVTAVVESTLPARRARGSRLALRAAAEHFGGGQTHFGVDAAFKAALAPRLRLELSAGLREALVASAPNGRVVASALAASAMLGVVLFETPSFEIALDGGGRAAWARFRGEATGDAVESELTGLAAYARAGLGAAARVAGPLWIELGASAGLPVRSLGARDGDRVVTAISGAEIAGRLGLAAEF